MVRISLRACIRFRVQQSVAVVLIVDISDSGSKRVEQRARTVKWLCTRDACLVQSLLQPWSEFDALGTNLQTKTI